MVGLGQVGLKQMDLRAQRFEFSFGLLRGIFGGVVMQRNGIPHAGKSQREGFAKSLRAASHKSKRFRHGWIVNEKNRFKGITYNLKNHQKKEGEK